MTSRASLAEATPTPGQIAEVRRALGTENVVCCPRCGGTGEIVAWNTYGERIKYLRELRGMTQGELAKAVGCGRTQITNVEADRSLIDLRNVRAFADALKCDLQELIP